MSSDESTLPPGYLERLEAMEKITSDHRREMKNNLPDEIPPGRLSPEMEAEAERVRRAVREHHQSISYNGLITAAAAGTLVTKDEEDEREAIRIFKECGFTSAEILSLAIAISEERVVWSLDQDVPRD